jgi:hypothetical protein
MGSESSPNHEWIELYNGGDTAVEVANWIVTDGNNLVITLPADSTIPPRSYAVLERTSDESAPVTAFFIYTGALVNTGATLTLTDVSGTIVDQVSGGENWQSIGGDNVTKSTPQYTPNGWVTASPTPGKENASVTSTPPQSSATSTSGADATNPKSSNTTSQPTQIRSGASSAPVRLVLPNVDLALRIDSQSIGYVHQPIIFRAEASGIGKTHLDSLSYVWNFGDGTVGSGKSTWHHFDFPGTYVVTLHAAYGRHEQRARHEITIVPPRLSLTRTPNGDIQINNDAPYEVDLSNYLLRGAKDLTLPPYTILLPTQTITIPKHRVGAKRDALIALYDEQEALIASTFAELVTPKNTFAVHTTGAFSSSDILRREPSFVPVTSEEQEPTALSFRPPVATTEMKQTMNASTPSNSTPIVVPSVLSQSERWPFALLAIVVVLAIFGVYLRPTRNLELS